MDDPTPSKKLRRRLGKAGVAQVAARYEAGDSIKQIATSIEASNDAVLRLLGEEGVPTRQPRYLSAAEKAAVVRRYEGGESIYQIEAHMEIPKTTVGRTLHRAGVHLRKR